MKWLFMSAGFIHIGRQTIPSVSAKISLGLSLYYYYYYYYYWIHGPCLLL